MKHLVFLVLLIFISVPLSAQETVTVNGKTHELKTEVEGELDLLWNIIDKHYHYFVKTSDGKITELLNTKEGSTYKEEYKMQLAQLTQNKGASTNDLNFTLQDLKEFVKTYNTALGNSYDEKNNTLKLRLGVFGGITNQPFVTNPNNTTVPFFGAELEGLSSLNTSRHAGFFSVVHALDHDNFQYSSTQLALGYRYRFINTPNFNIYGNLKLATYTFSKETFLLLGAPSETVKESTFQIPCSFGLGADIKVSNNSFITLSYNNLFAIFTDNAGNFPIDFALGYKFGL